MILRHFFDDGLAQASYLVGCAATGEALIVDPTRATTKYREAAKALGLRIVGIAETHIHADYVSGTKQLSAETGARMYLSGEGGPDWQYAFGDTRDRTLMSDGDVVRFGNLSIRAIHTPGHTPEHLAYLLTDHATSELPVAMFTGDFVFVGDVGRPDLLEKAAGIEGTMEAGAKLLFHSLQKLRDLPDSLLLWPGHGAGSACGKSLGGSPVTTLGYERRANWAFQIADESKFVDEVLAGQPEPPPYFARMKHVNKVGPELLEFTKELPHLQSIVGELVDVRPIEAIRGGASPEAVLLPGGKGMLNWAGWMLQGDLPYTLVAESPESADAAARELVSIGVDHVAGWIRADQVAGAEPVAVRRADELEGATVLDVRSLSERGDECVEGSVHIPLQQLSRRLGELPRHEPIVAYCASGYRTIVAYGLLRRMGFDQACELAGGIEGVRTACPEKLIA